MMKMIRYTTILLLRSNVQSMITAWGFPSHEENAKKIDHRILPRRLRKSFAHDTALRCIVRDYLGPKPIFNGREFDVMFRTEFALTKIMEDVGNSNIPSYINPTPGSTVASCEDTRVWSPIAFIPRLLPDVQNACPLLSYA
jgi:hypothetical protein